MVSMMGSEGGVSESSQMAEAVGHLHGALERDKGTFLLEDTLCV